MPGRTANSRIYRWIASRRGEPWSSARCSAAAVPQPRKGRILICVACSSDHRAPLPRTRRSDCDAEIARGAINDYAVNDMRFASDIVVGAGFAKQEFVVCVVARGFVTGIVGAQRA